MDIDGSGKVGHAGIVEPVVVGEPAIGSGHGHEVAGPGMVETVGGNRLVVEHLRHTLGGFEHRPDFWHPLGLLHIDVGDLVISHGKGIGGSGIEEFPAQIHLLHPQQTSLPQGTVEMHAVADRRDPILRKDDNRVARIDRPLPEIASHSIDRPAGRSGLRGIGAEALEVVVEMGQIAECHRGPAGFHQLPGGRGDPLR